MRVGIWSREKFEHNTDPQRRCYNGAHFSSEWRWSEWHLLYHVPEAEAQECLDGWKRIGRPTCQFVSAPEGQRPE